MKKSIISIAIILVLPLAIYAQTESLMSGFDEKGGYGGPSIKFMEAANNLGLLVGGQGAMVFGKTFSIGGGGWGLVTEHTVTSDTGKEFQPDFSYGGLLLEYIINPDKMIHKYFDLLIAWGNLSFKEVGSYYTENSGDDIVFLLEPGAYLALNVTPTIRVCGGLGYRFLFGMNETTPTEFGLYKKDIEGYSINLTIRFGKY